MLRPYQYDIAEHIIKKLRCNVWASMGSGKTLATLTAIRTLKAAGQEVLPVLVVAPLRVANSVWMQEAQKWPSTQDLRVVRITGTPRQRQQALNTPADIYTINFEGLPWLSDQLTSEWPFRMVVVDEASRLKGFRTRGGSKRCMALAKRVWDKTERFVSLTGTPAPNGLLDLWGQQWFIDRGFRLGKTFTAFRDRWFRARRVGQSQFAVEYRPLPNADVEIRERMAIDTLTVDIADYMPIDQPVCHVLQVVLPSKAQQAYGEMEEKMFLDLKSGAAEAVNAASLTSKCHQIANGALYLDEQDGAFEVIHDAKLDVLESVIEEAAGEPVLVAYQFKSDLARLKARFPQGRELTHSSTLIAKWNDGDVPLMFVHPQSAGHGLNLAQGGHILAFFSVDWNLEYHLQVIERIGPARQAQLGSGKACLLYYLVAQNTVDELIMQRLQDKRSVQDILTDAMKRRAK